MPSITSPSDFKAELTIANATVSPTINTVQSFIDKYEVKWIYAAMGKTFGDLFIAGIGDAGRWDALLNDNDLKTAIASFVYYWYQRNHVSQTNGSGEGISKNANATPYTPVDKMFRAWYEMVCIGFALQKYLTDNADTYPEYSAPLWYTNFSLSWVTWGWGLDIFQSQWFYGFYRYYKIPDIYIPLSRL